MTTPMSPVPPIFAPQWDHPPWSRPSFGPPGAGSLRDGGDCDRSDGSLGLITVHYDVNTSSTAQGGGGTFKNRKPIGEIGCCESGMAERIL